LVELGHAKAGRISWIYSVLPINMASGPASTFVQLYLMQLNGVSVGTLYVAVAATAFNAVSIPAAVIWGIATDRLQSRRLIIVISYGATALLLVSFLFSSTSYAVVVLYSAFSFMSSASATPLDLLIMETEPKNRWASALARLSMVSSLGVALGLILSSVWTQFLPFLWLTIPLAVLSLISVILSMMMIQEPVIFFEEETVVLQKPSFFQRLLQFPLIFLTFPRLSDFKSVFKGLRNELTSYIPMLYISIICFYLSSGIFNTSLVPALSGHAISESEVYLVSFAAMVIQILSFRYAGAFIEKRSLTAASTQGLVLRGVCYGLMGAAALLLSGFWFIVPALILYPLAGGVAYAVYYTASNTMVFNSLEGRSHGAALGVYSAVVGVSTMMGAVISGLTSFYLGFYVTFTLAALVLGVAAYASSKLSQELSRGPDI
jgi:MFS family permease